MFADRRGRMSTRARLPAGQMAPGVKRRMPERLTEEAKGFQLMDISFRSFQINNGWNQVRQAGAPVKPSISMQRHSLETQGGRVCDSTWLALLRNTCYFADKPVHTVS